MFETGIRQFRMAMSMVWGRRIDPANIARLVEDALATIAEFGEPGSDARELLEGPFADPAARTDFAERGLRRTARRLVDQSPFYARRFASAAEVDPAALDLESLRAIPVTTKRDLVERPQDFLCSGSTPQLATRTTGTTGNPAEIWMSRYELELWSGLSALTGVLRDEIRAVDVIQVNVSSRATASVHLTAAICRLVGAGCRVLGVVPTDEALDGLAGGDVTLLSASPSYLAELVVAARRRGMGPDDFALRRIDVGGEILTAALKQAAAETFGARINDVFAMTEVIPVSAATCSQGHLHHDLNSGLVELLDLDTGERAEPGALATVVITPYYPYRECMPVFRYDTRDVVRVLPDEPLTCEIAGLPGTGAIVGKADQILRTTGGTLTPRAVAEAIEALPSRPWPARFRVDATNGSLPTVTLTGSAVAGLGEAATRAHLHEHGVNVDLTVVDDAHGPDLRPLRCDLHETTFVARPALIGH